MSKYSKLNSKDFEKLILIDIRKKHINDITKQFIDNKIISNEYLDQLIKINSHKNNKEIVINNESRYELLNNLLQKECCKETAKFISQL